MEYSEYSLSAVSISADSATVRFFLDKIRLVRYEKFATMQIFLKKIRTPVNFIPHYNKNRLVRVFSHSAVLSSALGKYSLVTVILLERIMVYGLDQCVLNLF